MENEKNAVDINSESVKEKIKAFGKRRFDYLMKQGFVLKKDSDDDYIAIYSAKGEYLTLLDLPAKQNFEVAMIYKHKLTSLSSIGTAENGNLSAEGCNPISIGYNEKEKAWYGWTHRGGGKFYVGYKVVKDSIMDVEPHKFPYVCKTDMDAKKLAIDIVKDLD